MLQVLQVSPMSHRTLFGEGHQHKLVFWRSCSWSLSNMSQRPTERCHDKRPSTPPFLKSNEQPSFARPQNAYSTSSDERVLCVLVKPEAALGHAIKPAVGMQRAAANCRGSEAKVVRSRVRSKKVFHRRVRTDGRLNVIPTDRHRSPCLP